LLLEEFNKVASDGITQAELDLAKGNISGGLALKFESSQARMSRLISSEIINGQFIDLDSTLASFEAVTLREVQQLAADIAARDRTIVAVGDIKEAAFKGI
jgi:predicted Zn-dependent peptidase